MEDTNQKLQQHIVLLSSSQSEQIERGLQRSDGITRQLAAAHADGIAIYDHWYRIPTPLAGLEMLSKQYVLPDPNSSCFLVQPSNDSRRTWDDIIGLQRENI